MTGPARLPVPKRHQRHRPDKLGSTLAGPTTRAAVLVCLFQDDDGCLQVILTKRASTLSSHSGEVSLPGGKRDEGDCGDVDTVLQEAKEEIGLEPSLVNVVSVLDPFVNKGCYEIISLSGSFLYYANKLKSYFKLSIALANPDNTVFGGQVLLGVPLTAVSPIQIILGALMQEEEVNDHLNLRRVPPGTPSAELRPNHVAADRSV